MRQIEELTSLPTSNNINEDIRSILAEARRITARAVNTAMVTAYWLIGKRIVLEEQKGQDRANYGEKLLKNLSKELTAEFGNGFSYANLYNMRLFYIRHTQTRKNSTHCV